MKTVLEKAKVEESVFLSFSSPPFKGGWWGVVVSHFVDHVGSCLSSRDLQVQVQLSFNNAHIFGKERRPCPK